jgi:hypothetical protein
MHALGSCVSRVAISSRGKLSVLRCFALRCVFQERNSSIKGELTNAGHCLLILGVAVSHTNTCYRRYESSERVISPPHRPLPDSRDTHDIHAFGGIRTRNPSKPAVADARLRARGHWDRPSLHVERLQKVFQFVSSDEYR